MKKKRLDKEVYTCLCLLNLLEKWMISPFFFKMKNGDVIFKIEKKLCETLKLIPSSASFF